MTGVLLSRKQYVASDWHLGYEYTNYDKILEFLDLVESKADNLILVGDTFDLWRYPISQMEYSNTGQCLRRLKEVADKLPVTIIPGNHDYNLKRRWPKLESDYNVTIQDDFAYEGIYYTHGWQFDILQRRYSWAYTWLTTKFPWIYQRFFKKPSRMGLPKADGMTEQIEAVHLEAAKYMQDNEYDFICMGHTHRPGAWPYVIDVGDFVDSCSYGVIETGEKPVVRYI